MRRERQLAAKVLVTTKGALNMDKKDIDELSALMPILEAFVDLLIIKRELQAQLEPTPTENDH